MGRKAMGPMVMGRPASAQNRPPRPVPVVRWLAPAIHPDPSARRQEPFGPGTDLSGGADLVNIGR